MYTAEAAMSNFVILSKQKPPKGAPCNGCGFCCQNKACLLSVEFLKSDAAPCVALEWDGQSYRCGLTSRPSAYADTPAFCDEYLSGIFIHMLGIGKGCDADY